MHCLLGTFSATKILNSSEILLAMFIVEKWRLFLYLGTSSKLAS